MKKAVIILTLTSLVYTSCENSNNSTKEKELKLRELELKQKEEVLLNDTKEEIELKEQELVQKEKELNSTSNDNKNLSLNTKLIPQEIEYDGKPYIEYTINNKIIALDSYSETDTEGEYIRMKFNNKEVILKMQKKNSSKAKEVYSNTEYTVAFYDIVEGYVGEEGSVDVSGKLLIESKTEQNTINFKGTYLHKY
jgi:hypothetical protein